MYTQKIQLVSTKGQIVIPYRFRELLGIKPQSKVILEFVAKEKKIHLTHMTDPIEALTGVLKSRKLKAQIIKNKLRKEEAAYEKNPRKIRT